MGNRESADASKDFNEILGLHLHSMSSWIYMYVSLSN